MLHNYWKFPNRNVQTFGFVYHDTNGRSHGPVSKTQSFLLNGICMVILWQDYYGKGNLRKSYWDTVGRKFPIGNAYSYNREKGLFLSVFVDDIKLAGKKQRSDVESTEQRSWFGTTNIFPWLRIPGVYSTTMWNKQRYCWQLQKHVWIQSFSRGNWKTAIPLKIIVFLHGLMIWLVMQRSVWNDVVSWRTKRLNNSTKYQHHALMIITSKKKKWNPCENCQKYALILFWNACTWLVLVDLIFYGPWTNLHHQSPNGPKLVTNAWIDWFQKIITHVNIDNVVMWVTLPNNADWDCFKTLILREILRIPFPLLEEHCAFLEVIPLYWLVGCAGNKHQFLTVQQNPKSSLWTLDWDWTGFPLSIYGIWLFVF